MTKLLDLDSMQERIVLASERWVVRTRSAEEIPHLLRDVFLRDEVSRGEARRLLQKPERTARRILGTLVEEGLLVSDGPGEPLRMGFPAALVGYYFPRLYPEGLPLRGLRRSLSRWRLGSNCVRMCCALAALQRP